MKIMHNSDEVKFRKANVLNEVITAEQRRFEDSGLVFIANSDTKTKDPVEQAWMQSARKGWQGIRYGNAYDRNGNFLLNLRAMYGLPWYK